MGNRDVFLAECRFRTSPNVEKFPSTWHIFFEFLTWLCCQCNVLTTFRSFVDAVHTKMEISTAADGGINIGQGHARTARSSRSVSKNSNIFEAVRLPLRYQLTSTLLYITSMIRQFFASDTSIRRPFLSGLNFNNLSSTFLMI